MELAIVIKKKKKKQKNKKIKPGRNGLGHGRSYIICYLAFHRIIGENEKGKKRKK